LVGWFVLQDYKDKVLTPVLAFITARAAAERAAGLTTVPEDDGEVLEA
jgi:hypothetical protein